MQNRSLLNDTDVKLLRYRDTYIKLRVALFFGGAQYASLFQHKNPLFFQV
jgi:hypothetical protein